jgi:drug/metabolite transporter (DMT)-like permease
MQGLQWRRRGDLRTCAAVSNAFLYLTTVAIWGSSWIGVKLQLGVVAPEVSVAYRFAIAAALLLAWCKLRGLSLRFSRSEHLMIAIQGVLIFSVNYILFYFAIDYVTSGLVALIFSTIVVMNIGFGALLLGSPIRPRVALGGVLGTGGLALVFWHDLAAFDLASPAIFGFGLALLGTMSASLGNVASARNQRAGIPVVQSNALGMAYGTAFTLAVIVLRGLPFAFDPSPAYVGSLLGLALLGSIVAFWCYFTLLGRIGADRAAYSAVAFPLVALALSTLFEGFEWTPLAFAGVALIVLGNIAVLARIVPPRPALSAR